MSYLRTSAFVESTSRIEPSVFSTESGGLVSTIDVDSTLTLHLPGRPAIHALRDALDKLELLVASWEQEHGRTPDGTAGQL